MGTVENGPRVRHGRSPPQISSSLRPRQMECGCALGLTCRGKDAQDLGSNCLCNEARHSLFQAASYHGTELRFRSGYGPCSEKLPPAWLLAVGEILHRDRIQASPRVYAAGSA